MVELVLAFALKVLIPTAIMGLVAIIQILLEKREVRK